MAKCALCRKEKELRNSHIIPKNIVKWFKETSPTGYLRKAELPNVPQQDYYAIKLLCDDCEELFSKGENYFKQKIFLPFQEEHKRDFNFDERLEYFIASVAWRILILMTKMRQQKHLSLDQRLSFKRAEIIWRKFLLGERNDVGPYHCHLITMGLIQSVSGFDESAPINQYFMRSLDMDLICKKDSCAVYANMCGILILGFVAKNPGWDKTKTRITGSGYCDAEYVLPVTFGEYLHSRALNLQVKANMISDKQNKKIIEKAMKDVNKTINSRSIEAIRADRNLKRE